MRHTLLISIMLISQGALATESAYRHEDVEQIGPHVAPLVEIREPRPRDDRRIRSGGRVLLHPLPQGDIVARFRRKDASIGYQLEW
jgi:hypothetical protein